MVVDDLGRAYVGSQARRGRRRSCGSTPTTTVTVVAEDLDFPNGMVITPDGATLIVAESTGRRLTAFTIGADGSLSSRRVRGGTLAMPSASVVLSDGNGKVEGEGSGNGMIDAAVDAISQATGVSGTVLDFKVSSVTSGGDALGDVVILLDSDGVKASGRGVSTDVVEASARAYLERGQQDRAAARAPRPACGRRGRALTKEPERVRAARESRRRARLRVVE